MLAIRRCTSCGKEFDAEVGTADRTCPSCGDILGDWGGAVDPVRRADPRNRRGETWEEQAQRMSRSGKKDGGSIDEALRSCGSAYLKLKGMK